MKAGLIRSIGGYEGSPYPHPQRQLDARLREAGYTVEERELPNNAAPDFDTCLAFLRSQCQGLESGGLILHSLSSRLFFIMVDQLRQQGALTHPLVHTAVLLAPANGRYIGDFVPAVAPFFTQEVWTPALDGAAQRLLIVASTNDPHWEEASADLALFQRQPGIETLVLPDQGHLNDPDTSGDLPDVRRWIMQALPH